VFAGPDAGKSIEFVNRARVGAKAIADFALSDPKVSALHCEIELGADLWLRDLGSKNGTFVGNLRIREAALSPGDGIRIGDSRLRVQLLGDGAPIPLAEPGEYFGLIGQSPEMRALIARIERLSTKDTRVLIQGETGTGKERIANALHLSGPRAQQPLVVVDCGALTTGLIESELFGHEKGAFTGAVARSVGAFERANSGTVFLDEIGELPLALQPKLLRALESGEVRRLGGDQAIPLDVRVIAATHRDLALEVAHGRFREDLYYRLTVVTLTVPPLRDRIEDIVPLSIHLLRELDAEPSEILTPDAIGALESFDWPGNVRQLRNTLEQAVSLTEPLQLPKPLSAPGPAAGATMEVDLSIPLRAGKARVVRDYERSYLTAMLKECKGNITEVGRRAGMDRMSIHRILQRLRREP
jgi:DNA-binding NtrC family response regulator